MYSGGPDYPWWKFINRPTPKFEEVNFIKQRSHLASNVAFEIDTRLNVEYKSYALEGVTVFGVSEEENEIQPIKMGFGRFISDAEFASGSPVAIIGYTNAENLFVNPSLALGKEVKIGGMKATIVGVIKKMGTSMIGWDYDQCLITPYRFARQIFNDQYSSPKMALNPTAKSAANQTLNRTASDRRK